VTYLCAISCCGEDAVLAARFARELQKQKSWGFFYRRDHLGYGLMLNAHSDIFAKALGRIYFLRSENYQRQYTRFELLCGRGRNVNIVVPTQGRSAALPPNEFAFVTDAGWEWLPDLAEITLQEIAAIFIKRLKKSDLNN
jgi:hypothetical protein